MIYRNLKEFGIFSLVMLLVYIGYILIIRTFVKSAEVHQNFESSITIKTVNVPAMWINLHCKICCAYHCWARKEYFKKSNQRCITQNCQYFAIGSFTLNTVRGQKCRLPFVFVSMRQILSTRYRMSIDPNCMCMVMSRNAITRLFKCQKAY